MHSKHLFIFAGSSSQTGFLPWMQYFFAFLRFGIGGLLQIRHDPTITLLPVSSCSWLASVTSIIISLSSLTLNRQFRWLISQNLLIWSVIFNYQHCLFFFSLIFVINDISTKKAIIKVSKNPSYHLYVHRWAFLTHSGPWYRRRF